MPTARGATAMVLAATWAVLGSADRQLQAQPQRGRSSRCMRQGIGPLVANVPSVEVRPQFRLNGKPFPVTRLGVAVFTLWASHPSDLFDGPQLSLGQTDEPPQPARPGGGADWLDPPASANGSAHSRDL